MERKDTKKRCKPTLDLAQLRAKQIKRSQSSSSSSTSNPSKRIIPSTQQQSCIQPPLHNLEPLQINKSLLNNAPCIPPPKPRLINPFMKKESTRSCVSSSKENPFSILNECASSDIQSESRTLLRSFSCTDISRYSPLKNRVDVGEYDSDEEDLHDTHECMSDVEVDVSETLKPCSLEVDLIKSNSNSSITSIKSTSTTIRNTKALDTSSQLECLLLKKPMKSMEILPIDTILISKSKNVYPSLQDNTIESTTDKDGQNDEHDSHSDNEDQTLQSKELEIRYSNSSSHAPLEWNLKSECIIYSKHSFEWCQTTKSTEECDGLTGFVMNHTLDTVKLEFEKSLYRFEYPTESNAPSHIALLSKILGKSESKLKDFEALELAHYKEKEEEWKMSFRSIYFLFKNQIASYFYYINSSFAVLFYYKESVLSAILSKSTPGLRHALKDDGIDFKALMDKDDPKEMDQYEEKASVLNEMEANLINKKLFLNDELHKSKTQYCPLEFTGASQVHALYDFLLEWKEQRTDKRASSFPTLLSCKPFLNASIKSAKMIKSHLIKQSEGDGYKLLIKGILLPESLKRILELIQAQNKDFTLYYTLVESTMGIEKTLKKNSTIECVDDKFYY